MTTDVVTISRDEYEQMVQELEAMRDSKVYQRLLEFEENIAKGRKYARKDLGF